MANPIVMISLLAVGAYALFAKKEDKPAQQSTLPGGVTLPTVQTTPSGQTTITIPPSSTATIPVPGVAPEHAPQVTVTPTAEGMTPQQMATAVIPQLANQIAKAAQQATGTDVIGKDPISLPPLSVPSTPTIPVIAPTPLHEEEVKIDQDPYGTVALAKMLINAESGASWKTALKDLVAAWQTKRGLTADGKFGPKSALLMADEVGVLPLIRYFPSGSASKTAAVRSYRDQLMAKAASFTKPSDLPLSAALRISAQYEAGQGFDANPKPVSSATRVAQAEQLKTALNALTTT